MAVGTALAIAGGVSALVGGVANFAANSSASDRAAALQDKSLQEWLKVNIPNPDDQKIALQRFVQQGQIDPKLETAIKQDPSAFQKITTSSVNKSAQDKALSELENIGYSGGLRLQDKAALQDAQMQSQVKARADREGIEADMARRGLGGSGFDVASQLEAQQGGADRNAKNSLAIAAQAQDRALQSIEGAGNLATQYSNQDFSQQSAKAQAQDAINRFNTSNLQDVQQRNVGSQNAAQAANLAEKQKIADQNVNTSNQEQQYNKGLAQQQFENQAKVAAGKSGQYGQMADTAVRQGQNQGNLFSNIAGGVTGAATTLANQSIQKQNAADQRQADQDYWSNIFNSRK